MHQVEIKPSHTVSNLSFLVVVYCIYRIRTTYTICIFTEYFLLTHSNRRFAAVVFTALSLGRASSFAPDASRAQVSAGRIFALFNRKPLIDSTSTDGERLVSVCVVSECVKPCPLSADQHDWRSRSEGCSFPLPHEARGPGATGADSGGQTRSDPGSGWVWEEHHSLSAGEVLRPPLWQSHSGRE